MNTRILTENDVHSYFMTKDHSVIFLTSIDLDGGYSAMARVLATGDYYELTLGGKSLNHQSDAMDIAGELKHHGYLEWKI